jgi:16S rRNA (guanine966-N2)-methyltransferase
LRITGGSAKNRRVATPAAGRGDTLRPTSDRVREALFSILGEHIRGSRVLDLFAGTGCLGLEALSRGASQVIFVDRSSRALDLVHKNMLTCFPDAQAEILRLNLAGMSAYLTLKKRFAGQDRFNYIFMDPPYEKKLAEKALTMVEKAELSAPDGAVIVEERWNTQLPESIGDLLLQKKRRYGETGIWIYGSSRR